MDDQEKQARFTVVVGHFAAFGINGDKARVRVFCNDTSAIPLAIFADSCELARQLDESNWPSSAGAVIKAALAISPKEHDASSRDPRQRPEWWLDMVRRKRLNARNRLTAGGRALPTSTTRDLMTGDPVEELIKALRAPGAPEVEVE